MTNVGPLASKLKESFTARSNKDLFNFDLGYTIIQTRNETFSKIE